MVFNYTQFCANFEKSLQKQRDANQIQNFYVTQTLMLCGETRFSCECVDYIN